MYKKSKPKPNHPWKQAACVGKAEKEAKNKRLGEYISRRDWLIPLGDRMGVRAS